MQPPAERPVRFDVSVPPDLMAGAYANVMSVWSTAYEFTLDFGVTQPGRQEEVDGAEVVVVPSHVVARVKVPPAVVFDIMRALNQQLNTYEQAYGPITRPGADPPMYPPEEK